jgi:hypothetical protein
MPICPHCKKFTSFYDYGVDNVLEGEDAEEFIRHQNDEPTPKQIEMFKKAREIYRGHKITSR